MPRRRITAPLTKEQKQARKRRQDIQWLDKQVEQEKAWTQFSYPLHRFQYCYNLTDAVFLQIREDYLKGKPADDITPAIQPKSTDRIRQDIIAMFLILGYGLSRSEFIPAKQLATKRNTRRSTILEEERKLWPARPDIFLQCPAMVASAVSDDEIAEFFRHEYFGEAITEIEAASSDGIERQGTLNLSQGTSDVCRNDQTESGAILLGLDDNIDDVPLQHPPTNSTEIRDGPEINNRSVGLLKHLCLTFGKWGSIANTEALYGIRRSKAHEVRKSITSLRNGEIEGVTWEMFKETFADDELMQMPLQKSKEESIRQVVSIFSSE